MAITHAVARWGVRVAVAVLSVACVATLAYAVVTLPVRTLDGSEGHILFDAARIRSHLPLYTDPLVGAWDYGPIPSRYYVVYTPVWPWILSWLPERIAATGGRTIAALAWFGLLALVVARAAGERRKVAAVGALFVAGVYTLALYGACARPDAVAVLASGVALLRSVKKGRVGAIEGALFAVAPLVKPNVLGLAVGAVLAEIMIRRLHAWRAIAGAVGVGAPFALALHVASGGRWIAHVIAVNYGEMDMRFWLDQISGRLQFFGVPLAFAAWCGWRARADDRIKIALGALASSFVWVIFSLAKAGSATNYWMEPCVAGVVILAHAPLPPLQSHARAWASVLAIVQALWTGVASVRSSIEALAGAPQRARALARARQVCAARDDEVMFGEEAGLEFKLNDRVLEMPLSWTYLGRRGKFPEDLWIEDVRRRGVVGVVMQTDLLERPLSEVDREGDQFSVGLRTELRSRFALAERDAGLRTYCLRERVISGSR